MNRRQLLLGAASLAACKATSPASTDGQDPPTPSPQRDPSPAPHEPPGGPDLTVFPWGVYVGDPEVSSVEVRVRSTEEAIEIVWFAYEGAWAEQGRQTVSTSITASHRIEGLEPGRAYCVLAEAAGARSAVTRFRTAPAAGQDYELRIGATSCFGFMNPEMSNLEHTVDADLDVLLQLGDFVYADGSNTEAAYVDAWHNYVARPSVRAFVSATGLIHTWDDHEVDNNWTLVPGSVDSVDAAQVAVATKVWRRVVPMRLGTGGSQVWRTIRWGDIAEFFVLDCRAERNPGGLISPEQLAWFESAMAASTAAFKVVLSSVHLTDHTELFSVVQEQDRWQGHPTQRASMVAICANTPGTLVITGDMHFGAVMRVDKEGIGANVWEVAAGPGGSRLVPLDGIIEAFGQPEQYELLLQAWSWCDLRLNPGTMIVTVDFIGDAGTVLESREIQL